MKKVLLIITLFITSNIWAQNLYEITALECRDISTDEHIWIKVVKDSEQVASSDIDIPHSINAGNGEIFLPKSISWRAKAYSFELRRESLVLLTRFKATNKAKGRSNCKILSMDEWKKSQDNYLFELTKDKLI